MVTELYKANQRGHKRLSWLNCYHTFSFASFYDPKRVNFGALRILNDDDVIGGEGFETHPHENMEMISIPLFGTLMHKDSIGNNCLIGVDEVQVMSSGTGIEHSEYNSHAKKKLNFLQIWIVPNKEEVEPRYEHKKFDIAERKNQLIQVVSPNPDNDGLWIHQDTWCSIGVFGRGETLDYQLHQPGNGVFAMVIVGSFKVAGQYLRLRDAVGITETDRFSLQSKFDNSRILLIEVPMCEID